MQVDKMGYDIKTFLQKKVRLLKMIHICKRKKFPLKLLISCDVDPFTIPSSTKFSHPVGIVISKHVSIGDRCRIRQNVTIGARYPWSDNPGYPVIGNGVEFGASSLIFGDITIGDYAKIGAGAIVMKDVPEGATVTGVWK